jgi:hypothetical protein
MQGLCYVVNIRVYPKEIFKISIINHVKLFRFKSITNPTAKIIQQCNRAQSLINSMANQYNPNRDYEWEILLFKGHLERSEIHNKSDKNLWLMKLIKSILLYLTFLSVKYHSMKIYPNNHKYKLWISLIFANKLWE